MGVVHHGTITAVTSPSPGKPSLARPALRRRALSPVSARFRAKRKPMQYSRGLAHCIGSGMNHRCFSSRAEEKARDRPAARSLLVRDDQRRTHAADTASHLEGEAGGTLTSALDPVAHVSRYEKTVMAQEPRARTSAAAPGASGPEPHTGADILGGGRANLPTFAFRQRAPNSMTSTCQFFECISDSSDVGTVVVSVQ
jgi:hypothetical protein